MRTVLIMGFECSVDATVITVAKRKVTENLRPIQGLIFTLHSTIALILARLAIARSCMATRLYLACVFATVPSASGPVTWIHTMLQ